MIKLNKKLFKRTVASFLIIGMVALPGTYVPADEQDIEDAQNEADQIQQNIEKLQSDLDSLSSDIQDTNDYVSSLDSKLEGYSLKIYEYQQEVDAKQAEIDAKQQEITQKEADIETKTGELEEAQATETTQYEEMKLRIQYMYENGGESYINMIFESKNMAEFLNKAEYVSSISSYDREQLESYAATKQQITDLLATLETEKVNLETQKTTLVSEKSELEALMADVQEQQTYANVILQEKETSLANLQSLQTSKEDKLAAAQAEKDSQDALVEKMKAEWAAQQAASGTTNEQAQQISQEKLNEIGINGGFTWPLPGYNTITSYFGYRIHPIYGDYRLHDGTDISGSGVNGAPIVAAYDGTVILSQYYYGYGNCVIIDHGSGVQTLYAHCSSLLVSVGQSVSKGETIALVGSTGNSTGPHLHFSLSINGEWVSALDYVAIPSY